MADGDKTYQPGWGEKKHHHHHHHYTSDRRNSGFGGALRMKDKQAYAGLVIVVAVVVSIALYTLISYVVREVRAMPLDDPRTEMKVDELRIHKVDEHDALLAGDSLAQAYELDSSMIHRVQIETTPVFRQPRKNDKWYITSREWKDIKQNMKRWKKSEEKE